MTHHPLVAVVIAWWMLVGLTVQLSGNAGVIALTSILGPTVAVIVAHRLAKRTQDTLSRKLEDQKVAQELAADAARKAVAEAQVDAAAAQVTAEETHHLVNSQKDELERQRDGLKAELEARDLALQELRLEVEALKKGHP